MSILDAPGLTVPVADVRYPMKTDLVSGLGDFSPDGALIIACGDSTTEQFNQNGGGSQEIVKLRQSGEVWQNLVGFVNFGGSGYTLNGFVNDPIGTLPTIPTTGVGTISTWDYYGHKPTGAIPLATALAWRAGKADRALWRLCYGINDVILYAATGNLSQQGITDYLAPLLRKAINLIRASYPRDSIILDISNPMTARPFVAPGPGFPSYAAYPTFGADLATDQALVEKWNQAIRAAYVLVRNEFPKTKLIDSWVEVFGASDTTLVATTQLPYLVNLVHPTGVADAARIRAIGRVTKPTVVASEGRRAEADARSALLAVNPWDVYPAYFCGNVRYKLAAEITFVGAGSNFLDLGIPYAQFQQQVSGPVYVVVADRVAQLFPTYAAAASGANTRLTSVAPTAAMQAAVSRQSVQLYLDNVIKLVSDDSYVNTAAKAAKEYIELGTNIGGGAGYIDIGLAITNGRLSSKFAGGLKNGILVVGGTIGATLDLSTATLISRNGTTGQRSIRISIAGDYTTYAGKPAAITFADDKPSPKVWERVVTPYCVLPLETVGVRKFLFTDVPILDGVTFSAKVLGPSIAAILTIDVYSLAFNARTLLGTISIPSGGASGVLASGNPTTIPANTAYELVYTSASTSATTTLLVTATPV